MEIFFGIRVCLRETKQYRKVRQFTFIRSLNRNKYKTSTVYNSMARIFSTFLENLKVNMKQFLHQNY